MEGEILMSRRQAIARWLELTEWQRASPYGSPQYEKAVRNLAALKTQFPTLTFGDLQAYRRVTR